MSKKWIFENSGYLDYNTDIGLDYLPFKQYIFLPQHSYCPSFKYRLAWNEQKLWLQISMLLFSICPRHTFLFSQEYRQIHYNGINNFLSYIWRDTGGKGNLYQLSALFKQSDNEMSTNPVYGTNLITRLCVNRHGILSSRSGTSTDHSSRSKIGAPEVRRNFDLNIQAGTFWHPPAT